MLRTTVNTTRNLLFEIFLKERPFYWVLYRHVISTCTKQHAQNTLIYSPEDLQQFAHQKAERFSQSTVKRFLFIATKQHLEEAYTTTFIKFYNAYLEGTEKTKHELNKHPL